MANIVTKLPDKPVVDDYCTLHVSKEKVLRKQLVPYRCKNAGTWEEYIP